MKTNIFIPTKINVGFQNRSDTYTGKLAYVIYYDEKGKLRKETSWNSWRDKNIPNEEFENEPTEGFVLNRRAGGVEESWGWNPRKTYCRVYDPRGFEFEITIANLLWILENCNSIKGKGLEGEFVYGWDGKELVLVPVESPDYKEIQNKNKVIHNDEFVKAKDLIVGATYKTLNDGQYVYMGKFDKFERQTNYLDWNWGNKKWKYPLDETWHKDIVNGLFVTSYHRYINEGKQFFFIKLENDYPDTIAIFKSVTRKFSEVVDEKCHDRYIDFVEKINHSDCYCPVDYSKNTIISLPFENFERGIKKMLDELRNGKRYRFSFYVGFIKENGCLGSREICWDEEKQKFSVYIEDRKYYESIEDLYKDLSPVVYGEQYLENGNLFKRENYYE